MKPARPIPDLALAVATILSACGPSGPTAPGAAPACPRAPTCPELPRPECPRAPETPRAAALDWPRAEVVNDHLDAFLASRLAPPARGSRSPVSKLQTITFDFDFDSVTASAPSLAVPATRRGDPADLQAITKAWSQAAELLRTGRYAQAGAKLQALYRLVSSGPHARLAKQVLFDLTTALAHEGTTTSRAISLLSGLVTQADRPLVASLYLSLASRVAETGDHATALGLLGAVVSLAPSPPEPAYQALFAQAKLHAVAQRYDLVLGSLHDLLSLAAKSKAKPSRELTSAMSAELTQMARALHAQAEGTRHPRHYVSALGLFRVVLLLPVARPGDETERMERQMSQLTRRLVGSVAFPEPKAPPLAPCRPPLCRRIVKYVGVVIVGRCGKTDVRRILRSRLGEIRSCYSRELASEPALAGTVKLSLQIDPMGWIEKGEAKVVSGTLGARAASIQACIAARIKDWRFPESNLSYSSRYQVTYPVELAPER